ncbi:riboflavin biosynthesis protein [Spirochaetia bacterium]|nr:riboflavin biosynthesis protein [Spirochaetia bacterium]
MRILDWEEFTSPKIPGTETAGQGGLAVSIGVFDGVHRGHQRLIEKIVRHGDEHGSIPTVVTFKQSPRRLLHPDSWHGDIYSIKQKLSVFETLGVKQAVLIDFSENFSKITGREFVDLLKSRRRLDFLTVGANFRCGYRLDTDAAAIQAMNREAGISTEVLSQVLEGGHPVSSSRIRRAVLAGDLSEAALLLGRRLRIDLEGIPAVKTGTGVLYDAVAAGRIVPPAGLYPARIFQIDSAGLADSSDSREGIKTEISINSDGKILSPLGGLAVEFIN